MTKHKGRNEQSEPSDSGGQCSKRLSIVGEPERPLDDPATKHLFPPVFFVLNCYFFLYVLAGCFAQRKTTRSWKNPLSAESMSCVSCFFMRFRPKKTLISQFLVDLERGSETFRVFFERFCCILEVV